LALVWDVFTFGWNCKSSIPDQSLHHRDYNSFL
jgi:hypothetical protein